jgi:hypothetical protein
MKKTITLSMFLGILFIFQSCSNKTNNENLEIGRYQAFVVDDETVGVLDTKSGIYIISEPYEGDLIRVVNPVDSMNKHLKK